MSFFSWIILSLVLLLTVYGIFSCFRIMGLIKESSLLVKSAQVYEIQTNPSNPKILFVGDSTGVGVGASRREESVAGRFALDHPDWNVRNLSVSGRKTAALVPVLKGVSDKEYDQIILQVGGNDIVYFSSLPELEQAIKEVLLEAKRGGSKVALMTSGNVGNAPLLPRPFAFLWEKRTQVVREIFMRKAREVGVTYVDLYREDAQDLFLMYPLRYHAKDLFHPSSDGYGLWYEDLKKSL